MGGANHRRGIQLSTPADDDELDELDGPDELNDFKLVEETTVLADVETKGAALPLATRNAIIEEKAEGKPSKIVAIHYDVSPSTVDKVWQGFLKQARRVGALGATTPAQIKDRLRGRAVAAIENGLECDRDPYRQAAVGVSVMKGIGEFKGDGNDPASMRVNVLINQLPPEWKERYIGAGAGTIAPALTPIREDSEG
jgi:hypothetical protein